MDASDPARRIRVIVVDDHPAIRAGVASVLRAEPDLEVVAEGGNGEEAVELYRRHRPDVMLLDLRMPGKDGKSAIRTILGEFADARILAFTTYEGDADIRHALEAGASGYLLKDMLLTDVIDAIRSVHGGERVIPPPVATRLAAYSPRSSLTEREVEILDLVARGHSNKAIARMIGRTGETVKIHLRNIFTKLDVGDRTEAVTRGLSRGLIHLD